MNRITKPVLLGVALGPFVLGAAYDMAGYSVAYWTAVGMCAMALLIIAGAGVRPLAPAGEREPV